MLRNSVLLIAALGLMAGCQGWDRLDPSPAERSAASDGFTSLDGKNTGFSGLRLTNQVAELRLEQILGSTGEERLEHIDRFVTDFPEARAIPELHRLAGEGHLARDRPLEAAESFRLAVALSGTDILELPPNPELAYQLGWARYLGGELQVALPWLIRASLATDSTQLEEGLRWIHGEQVGSRTPFKAWLQQERLARTVYGPDFGLPGLSQPIIELEASAADATLLNFWSPT